ncbi:MAG: ATP-dependent sacrificial sulfur transferase LarE [bacterium]|nr:MAG: ATP-dependent sacrificial sulfur transferase LarE [bacterium]
MAELNNGLRRKLEQLKEIISRCNGALVAFSGGVDSTFLLDVTREVLGENVLAVTITGPLFPSKEIEEAQEIASVFNVEQVVVEIDEMKKKHFKHNPPDRCYHCKRDLFSVLLGIAKERNLDCVFEASNMDDTKDHRPGMKAVKELGVKSPLIKAGITKEDVRALSKERGLTTWDKLSMACFASRVPYNQPITPDKIQQIRKAEDYLCSLGFHQCRLRHHGAIARIEVAHDEIRRIVDEPIRRDLVEHIKGLGFKYVTIDLEGFRSGSLNEELDL